MTKKYQEETNDRTRYNLHLPNEVMSLIQKWYKDDGCTTMNEFVERAIKFYAGYVSNEQNHNYLPNIVLSTMKSIVRESENRHNRNLYRIALEMSMLMNIMAATHHIPEDSLAKLRGDCEEEIRRINGTLSIDTAVRWQS